MPFSRGNREQVAGAGAPHGGETPAGRKNT